MGGYRITFMNLVKLLGQLELNRLGFNFILLNLPQQLLDHLIGDFERSMKVYWTATHLSRTLGVIEFFLKANETVECLLAAWA